MKKQFWLGTFALVMLISACNNNDSDHSNTVVETKKQPNILFIMADDLGYSYRAYIENNLYYLPHLAPV